MKYTTCMSVGEEGKRRPNQLYYLYLYLVLYYTTICICISMSSSDYLFTRTFRPRTRIVPPWPWHHPGPFESPSDGSPCTPPTCPPRAISAPATAACFGISVLVHRSEVPDPDTENGISPRRTGALKHVAIDRADETATERLHPTTRAPRTSAVARMPYPNPRVRSTRRSARNFATGSGVSTR